MAEFPIVDLSDDDTKELLITTARNRLDEVNRLREILWKIYLLTGADTDGDTSCPRPGVYSPDIPELALRQMQEFRDEYDALLRGDQ
jgi:hypothetical protein